MKKKPTKKPTKEELKSLSPIEALRIQRTDLNRDEFVVYCGFGRGSYYRWITGQSEGKVTLTQLKKMAKLLGIERIDQLPDDFAPPGVSELKEFSIPDDEPSPVATNGKTRRRSPN